jgi:hypothetical protein
VWPAAPNVSVRPNVASGCVIRIALQSRPNAIVSPENAFWSARPSDPSPIPQLVTVIVLAWAGPAPPASSAAQASPATPMRRSLAT